MNQLEFANHQYRLRLSQSQRLTRGSALALQRLAEEDPTFRIHTDEEMGQTIMLWNGTSTLDILIDRMKREFKVEA